MVLSSSGNALTCVSDQYGITQEVDPLVMGCAKIAQAD
jgi:hypothetical protein